MLKPTTETEELFLEVLKWENEVFIKGVDHEGYLFPPIGPLRGIHSELARVLKKSGAFVYDSDDDLLHPYQRLRAIPGMIEDVIGVLKEGMKKNVTFAAESIVGTWHKYDKLRVAKAENSELFEMFENVPRDKVDPRLFAAIVKISKDVMVEEVIPAFERLRQFLSDVYIKSVRPTPGLLSIPKGAELYRYLE